MKKILLVLSLIPITSFSLQESIDQNDEKYKIETFCQDLNVILQKVNIHSFNIANHETTRTQQGSFYKRKIIESCERGHCEIKEDNNAFQMKYRPSHPDANKDGYVAFPFFSKSEEVTLLARAQNAYELVIKNMPIKSIDLLVGTKLDSCFRDYQFFKEQFDFKSFLGRL